MSSNRPSASGFGVVRLLGSERDKFFENYWGKSFYHLARNSPRYYSGLFSIGDVDSVVSLASTNQGSSLSLVRSNDGVISHRDVPTNQGRPNIFHIYAAYSDGFTLVVNSLHMRWKAIAQLCSNLQAELNHRVGANLYLTPRSAQGFLPHFDDHDVFILQLDGQKTWHIYESEEALPIDETVGGERPNTKIGKIKQRLVLKPGDMLYIPRGYVHEAVTTESPSMHLTVGVHVYRWLDLLVELAKLRAKDDVRYRKSLPAGFINSKEDVSKEVKQLIGDMDSEAYIRNAIDKLGDELLAGSQPVPDGHFSSMNSLNTLNLNSRVRLRKGMRCSVPEEGERATIEFQGNKVMGPKYLKPSFAFIAKAERFRVEDLPGSLTRNGKLVLATRLVKEGLLTIEEN